jgi:hypothetical protein
MHKHAKRDWRGRTLMGRWVSTTLAASLLVCATTAQAQLPLVEIQPTALLLDGSVRVDVNVSCDLFGDISENNLTVTQDDQSIFAQRSIGTLLCDGQPHLFDVVATPFEGAFHLGPANVSAFVLQIDSSTGEARQGQDSRVVTVVPEPSTWMMMISGVAIVGAAMLRRRKRTNGAKARFGLEDLAAV